MARRQPPNPPPPPAALKRKRSAGTKNKSEQPQDKAAASEKKIPGSQSGCRHTSTFQVQEPNWPYAYGQLMLYIRRQHLFSLSFVVTRFLRVIFSNPRKLLREKRKVARLEHAKKKAEHLKRKAARTWGIAHILARTNSWANFAP